MQHKDWNDAYRAGGSAREAADAAWTQELHGPLVIACARDIKPTKVDWLWDQRLPVGKVVLFAGEGGLGKSMVLAWISARVSRGGDWPCGEGKAPRGSIIILSAEDDASDTIIPRLLAADADCSKVYILSAVRREDEKGHRTFNLQRDLPDLEKKIAELGDVILVVVDPITSYLGAVDSHRNAELRSVLEPLGEMAARLKVTVIANTHLSKATVGSANSRVIGSVAFVNHARAAFIVTADPEDKDRRLFIPSKQNLGRAREGLAYRIADTTIMGGDGEVISAPYVQWEDSTITMTADEAVAAESDTKGGTMKEDYVEFLKAVLANGPMKVKPDIEQEARDAGLLGDRESISQSKPCRRAREALGVIANKDGYQGKWTWSLPPKMPSDPKDAPLNNGAPLDEKGIFEEDQAADGEINGYPDLPDFLDRRQQVASEPCQACDGMGCPTCEPQQREAS